VHDRASVEAALAHARNGSNATDIAGRRSSVRGRSGEEAGPRRCRPSAAAAFLHPLEHALVAEDRGRDGEVDAGGRDHDIGEDPGNEGAAAGISPGESMREPS